MNIRRFSTLLLAACAFLFQPSANAQLQVVGDGGPGPVKAQHLTAELVSLAPSGTLQVGLVLTLEKHWHVYWINAGDSGEPPKITWTLPDGITAGPMQFPIPSRLPLGPLMDFGYEDEVAFPVQLTAASSLKPGPVHLDAIVNWLVCREVCIPGKAHLGLNLTVSPDATAPAQPVGAIGEALNLIPKPLPPDAKLTVTGGQTDFVLTLTTGKRETHAEFYPFDQDQIANAAPQPIESRADGVRLRVRRSEDLKTLPATLHGVLKLSDEIAYEFTAPVVPGEIAPAPSSSSPVAASSSVTTLTAIGLAFLGGIILNLMPCVFPVALSLAGLFDIGLSLTSVGGDLAQKQGYTGSFFTGVLATVVATPCTAPLMGAAIGFALAQPAHITFAIFTALGLGLAAPYLLLSFQPAWTRILPRPGAWMEIFKQLTAFIFFATVIWLVYVYGSLFAGGASGGQGIYRVALLLGCFLMLAVAGWVLGKWPARWPSTIAAILIAAIGLAIPLYQPKDTTLVWAPYSQQALDQARAAGHPVFIDFTAAWCLSCQVNERLVLRSADVQHQFSKNNVTLLRADWTQYDPEITKQLASVNRSGVPTYVIYPAPVNSAPDVLPELLTKDIVLTSLQKDTKK